MARKLDWRSTTITSQCGLSSDERMNGYIAPWRARSFQIKLCFLRLSCVYFSCIGSPDSWPTWTNHGSDRWICRPQCADFPVDFMATQPFFCSSRARVPAPTDPYLRQSMLIRNTGARTTNTRHWLALNGICQPLACAWVSSEEPLFSTRLVTFHDHLIHVPALSQRALNKRLSAICRAQCCMQIPHCVSTMGRV
ncbi:hypothetical protein BDW74DRAFT_86555 [Aspergillus multicolor]|uniref:uncharacterized protein n=1 Tax=Aspergillus multicolor TaxID=41759 RepID=UPI003CCDEDCB